MFGCIGTIAWVGGDVKGSLRKSQQKVSKVSKVSKKDAQSCFNSKVNNIKKIAGKNISPEIDTGDDI